MGIVKDFEKVAICADFEKNHEVVEDMVHARGREKVTCEDGWTSTSELGGALEALEEEQGPARASCEVDGRKEKRK